MSTSWPLCRWNTSRSSRRWLSSASRYRSAPSALSSWVDSSMSVKRKVMVPVGRSGIAQPLAQLTLDGVAAC